MGDHTGAVAVELAHERPLIGCEGGPSTCGPPHFLTPKGNGDRQGAEIDTWVVVGLGSPKPRVSLT